MKTEFENVRFVTKYSVFNTTNAEIGTVYYYNDQLRWAYDSSARWTLSVETLRDIVAFLEQLTPN
jgi:hypothetical protein